jgi:hypothetical protein
MDILPQAPVVPRDCLAVTNYDYVDLRVASPCPREAPTVAELRREPLPDADPGMTRPPPTAMRRESHFRFRIMIPVRAAFLVSDWALPEAYTHLTLKWSALRMARTLPRRVRD